MQPSATRTARSRGRSAAGGACLALGVASFLAGYGGVDISMARYVAFVGGGALMIAGLLLLRVRTLALVTAVFVAAVAFEGPIPAGSAQALHVLDDVRVPRYLREATGFVGPTRDFPYRLFVGPPEAIGPFMVRPPARFSLDVIAYTAKVGAYSSAAAAAPTKILNHEGFTRIASWHAPRVQGRFCTLELEVADQQVVTEALSGFTASFRSRLEGKAIIRLLSSCAKQALPGPEPTTGSTPSALPSINRRGGPG